jgi:enhanced filamentous growth protein 1
MAAAERRKQEQNQLRNNQAPGLPSMQSHHHHSMHNPIAGALPGPQHSLAPHPGIGRPDIQRAHTFPTPPTSASSVMGMGNSDGSFQWAGQGMGSVQGTNPLAIDTGISNARSMPTTPATTPPGAPVQSMQQYQQGPQAYDNSRQIYSAPSVQQNSYPQSNTGQQGMGRYGQTSSYIKNEMGPPTARAPGSGPDAEHQDQKGPNGLIHHNSGNDQVGHGPGEEEAEHEHDAEYTHDSNATYDAHRGPYNYAPPVGSLTGEHTHLSPEMTSSPSHQAGSGRATPRTATTTQQPYYTQQQGGYSTPPRAQPSSNLYNVMSSERGTANGSAGEVYASQPDLGNSMANGYPTQQPVINGNASSNKRGREEDDDGSRPASRGPGGVSEIDGLKRRKTIREGSVPNATYDASLNRRSAITQRRR